VVSVAQDGADAMREIETGAFDLIVLDIMLPGMDGWQILTWLRGVGLQAPILILTARDEVSDRVRGPELGADDYLVKPFAFSELLARVRAAATDILSRGGRTRWRIVRPETVSG
jgi:two-component system copper resistance phosphate regulon response regulator CusR